jgi:hypothetical protein
LFESVQVDDGAARFRSAAVPPIAAFAVALLYFTFYPMLGRVPAALFWSVVAILFIGVVAGAIAIVRAVRRERPRGRVLAWCVGAIVVELLCARTFLALALPWL